MRGSWFWLASLSVLLSTADGRAQHTEHLSIVPAEVPFTLSQGFLITVEGRIGPLSRLKFILDTGTTRSMVDRKIAEKLALTRHPSQLFEFDRVVATEKTTLPDVQVGPVEVANVLAVVADLRSFSRLANNADAVIGSDLLGLAPFWIDYQQRRVHFRTVQPSESYSPDHGLALLTVDLAVQGQQLRLLVDSGFPDMVLFEGRVRRRLPELKIAHVVDRFHIGGRVHAKKAVLPRTKLGGKDENVKVVLVDDPPEGVWPGVDGLLGIAFLKARRIDFDYATNHVSWE